jgi:Zn-dependent protease with chaperone function
VRLTTAALIAGPIALLLVSPWLAARLFDGRALAGAYLLRLGWLAAAAARANSRLATSTALAAAELLPKSGAGPVTHVLASLRPFAYTVGGRSGGVVVSRALLGLLDDDERDAMLAHELAHLRLRHHRLLGFAQVVTATLGPVAPAVHQAASSLARELEVIADQAAAGVVGDRRVVARALAKAALAAAASPAPTTTQPSVAPRTWPTG